MARSKPVSPPTGSIDELVEFFDTHDTDFPKWADRLSLDWQGESVGFSHSFTMFQEGDKRHLDLCIWFDAFEVRSPAGETIPLGDFCAAGERWWRGLDSGDSRVQGHGIHRLGD